MVETLLRCERAIRVELSPVLKAMGVPPEIGMGAIRFNLGRANTQEEVDAMADRLASVVAAVA